MLPHPSRRKRLETSQRAECERPVTRREVLGAWKLKGTKVRRSELGSCTQWSTTRELKTAWRNTAYWPQTSLGIHSLLGKRKTIELVLTEKSVSINFYFYIYGIMLNDGQSCIHPNNVRREGRKKSKKKKKIKSWNSKTTNLLKERKWMLCAGDIK